MVFEVIGLAYYFGVSNIRLAIIDLLRIHSWHLNFGTKTFIVVEVCSKKETIYADKGAYPRERRLAPSKTLKLYGRYKVESLTLTRRSAFFDDLKLQKSTESI